MPLAGIRYRATGVLNKDNNHKHIVNAVLRDVTGDAAGVDVVLGDGCKLRTFSSEQLTKHKCCSNGVKHDWSSEPAGDRATQLVWEDKEYDDLGMAQRIALVRDLKSAMTASQRQLAHSVSLSKGSLVATVTWKLGLTDVDALVLSDELSSNVDIENVQVGLSSLGTARVSVRSVADIATRFRPAASTVPPVASAASQAS